MAVKPPRLEIRCPQCGWQTVWQPQSDALTALPPAECPRCDHADLETRPASSVSALLGRVRNWLKPF